MFLRRKPKGAEGPVVMTLSSGCVISTKTRTLFMIFFYFNRCVCVCVFYTFLKRCHDYPAGLGIFTGGSCWYFFFFRFFLHNIYFILYFSLSFVCPLRYSIPGHLPFFFLRKAGTGDCEKKKIVCTHVHRRSPSPSFSLLVWFNNKNLGVNEFRFYVDCTQLLQRAPLHFIMNNSI